MSAPTEWDSAYMNLNREAGNISLPDMPEPSMSTADKLAVYALAATGTLSAIGIVALAIEAAAHYF